MAGCLAGRTKQLMNMISMRHLSTTRRLMSQEWQQHGVPGSNIPFDINNKYKFTFLVYLYTTTGLMAPFFLVRSYLINANKPEEVIEPQQLSTLYCNETAKK